MSEPADSSALEPVPARALPAWPDGAELLERERISRRKGSGIAAPDLVGTWLLQKVWPRTSSQPAAISAAILRSLGASLTLVSPSSDPDDPEPAAPFQIANMVGIGALELRFQGHAWLEGKRPLLRFRFERLQVRFGRRCWLDRPLAAPGTASSPFFALIATGSGTDSGSEAETVWLAARGKGGGLALWRRAEDPSHHDD
ncbi:MULTISPECIES: hypothetical protein [Synechococcaceae]|uniref:hypothetical protein n=1 Tax=Synechococcaceae TaxID=1890426 RepID=UPI000B197DA7|nr:MULTISPECIES: hypothetical protein [Synechococcaceae]MCT4365438.1 hypothetical protein [Candidatus Regnicoccus frigidus MAG-AL1]TWB96444.1 hypothetical protein FB106_101108 [Synechococcus sp. Ace-Pa]